MSRRLLVLAAAAGLVFPLAGCPSEAGSSSGRASASPSASPSGSSAESGRPQQRETVLVARGPFVMGSQGSSAGGRDDERPQQERQTGPFSIDLHEVTNAEYARFLASPAARDHSCCHPDEPPGKDHTPSKPTPEELEQGAVADPFGGEGRGDHPVVGVDWFDAYAFAAWLGRRLPSEDEWEKAARGPDGRVFPWGNQERAEGEHAFPWANALFSKDGYGMTAPVGSFPAGASPCGALDMAGNVWEWTDSPYLPYEGAPEGSPEDPAQRVIRGGGWNSASSFLLRAAMRLPRPRTFRSSAVGFRTAATEERP